jgi:hypothetical protein
VARTIERSVEINCPPDRVWAVLTDFPAHPDWNPFIQEISGNVRVGERLRVHIVPPGGRGMTFKPVVTAATPNREFGWLGKLGVKGLFDGAHSFHIEELPDGRSRVTQSETFSGVLVGLLGSGLDATADGFDQMNQALKQRCESHPIP